MAINLTANDKFNIVSLIDGNPLASVSSTRQAFQTVRLGDDITKWEMDFDGKTAYRFSVDGYRYTTVMKDRVTATIYEEDNVDWVITYHDQLDAYTISPVKDQKKGWTVTDRPPPYAPIVTLKPLTIPPSNLLKNQLFRLDVIEDQE